MRSGSFISITLFKISNAFLIRTLADIPNHLGGSRWLLTLDWCRYRYQKTGIPFFEEKHNST